MRRDPALCYFISSVLIICRASSSPDMMGYTDREGTGKAKIGCFTVRPLYHENIAIRAQLADGGDHVSLNRQYCHLVI